MYIDFWGKMEYLLPVAEGSTVAALQVECRVFADCCYKENVT
jgi:hypothetical protein